jgi:hypothetical protein
MSEVVRFRGARELEAERRREELRTVVRRLIEELGVEAGYQLGLVARLPKLAPEARERLLVIVDEIERERGLYWDFRDGEQSA